MQTIESTKRTRALRNQMLMSAAAIAMGVALFGASNQAQAQTPFNWSGFYIGADVGYGSTRFGAQQSEDRIRNARGIVAGLHGGYNWQMGSLVFGAEADLAVSSFKINISDNRYRTDLLSSLRGRLGFAFDRIMVYGTGGVGMVKGKVYSSDYASKAFTSVRPVLGAGAEWALNNNFILRAEFLDYVGGKKKVVSPEPETSTVRNTWVSRVGFSYKF